jgi:nitrate reductase NapAB chaperone NapD
MWNIPYAYYENPSPMRDLCWVKLPHDHDNDSLELDNTSIDGILDVNVVFRQPYDFNGERISNPYIGSTRATLYKTTNKKLIESLDIGFKGMSGAVAVSDETKLVGLFVKRANLIPLKSHKSQDDLSLAFSRKPLPPPPNEFSPFEKYLFEEIQTLKSELQILKNTVITKNDLKEISVVLDARRGIFLTSTEIINIIEHSKSIPIANIIGSTREKIGGDNRMIFSSFPERSEGKTINAETKD